MAPNKNHQKSTAKHKRSHKGDKQKAGNNVNTGPAHTATDSGANSSLQQSAQPYSDTSACYSTQAQPSTNEVFYIGRQPSNQAILISNNRGDTSAPTPMERWQDESTYDQPWHAVGGVLHPDEVNMDEYQQDISLSCDGYYGVDGYGYMTGTNEIDGWNKEKAGY
jgi:hypothetical protein